LNWSFARLIVAVVTTTSITLSSNKIQIGDILVLANPGPPGKMAIKMERYIAQDWDKEEKTITRRPESIHNVPRGATIQSEYWRQIHVYIRAG